MAGRHRVDGRGYHAAAALSGGHQCNSMAIAASVATFTLFSSFTATSLPMERTASHFTHQRRLPPQIEAMHPGLLDRVAHATDQLELPRAAPPSVACETELAKLCPGLNGTDHACKACVKTNDVELQKHGCRPADSSAYCAPPKLVCPPDLYAMANTTGRLSVRALGAVGDKKHDDQPAIAQTIAMAHACGQVEVWFPPGEYFLNRTLVARGGMSLVGSSGGGGSAIDGARTVNLYGPKDGPLLLVNSTGSVTVHNLVLNGQTLGVHIIDSAGIRFTNVGVYASVNSDGVDTSLGGCSNCNVVLGSNNTAMVVENSFWLWFETTSFEFLYYSSGCSRDNAKDESACWGQRPVIVLRGSNAPGHFGVKSVYLFVMKDSVISGGGVQYQQTADCGGCAAGFFDFFNVVLESSALPLLDVQSEPDVTEFYGLEHISIIDMMDADPRPAHFGGGLQNVTSVVHLNCSQPMCALDGLTMVGASPLGGGWNGFHIGHAVRVFAGAVRSITVLNSQHTGGLAVVDAAGVPFGSYVSKSAGGFVFLGEKSAGASANAALLPSEVSPHGNMTNLRGPSHALLFGVSGETQGRLAIETDGSMHFGDGEADFDTTIRRPRTVMHPTVILCLNALLGNQVLVDRNRLYLRRND